MKCEYCGSSVLAGDRFCIKCGAPLPDEPDVQEMVDMVMNAQAVPQNSKRQDAAQRREKPLRKGKSRLAAGLLCFLLGYTGAHRFYTGHWVLGILYLFTGGLFFFGWVIDLLRIICGTYRDASGCLLE